MTLALSKTAERGAVSSGQYRMAYGAPRDATDVIIKFPVFEPRVHAGMDLLDQVAAGWQDAIKTDTLDLNSPTSCILGQTWPHYARLKGLAEPSHALILGSRGQPYIGFLQTPFAKLADHLSDDTFHLRWAAKYGFALSDEDEATAEGAAMAVANRYPDPDRTTLYNDLHADLLRTFFQNLTNTWISMIDTGRKTGRWDRRPVEIVRDQSGAWRRPSEEPKSIPAERAHQLLTV